MKYKRFEELPVWKDAIELAVRTFALTAQPCFRPHQRLRSQLEAAVVSISNNIAEGFERGTTPDTLNFIYIARGSAGETRSMYVFLLRAPGFEGLRSDLPDLVRRAESISRQLRAWADALQNTDIRGQRYLTDSSRVREQRIKERNEFVKELEQIQEQNIARARKAGETA
jgi:four helix bundle protein